MSALPHNLPTIPSEGAQKSTLLVQNRTYQATEAASMLSAGHSACMHGEAVLITLR
jgi:hypothetical protein